MTKAMLQVIKAEYEYSTATIEELCDKYSCTTKDLKGYTLWNKTTLKPTKNKTQTDSYIKLVYETLYTPDLTTENEAIDSVEVEAEVIDSDDDLNKDIIHQTADKILNKKPITKSDLPQQMQDGFEGLRKLDTKLQEQSLRLLDRVDSMLIEAETPKELRDLAAVHTTIRDTYFNTKSPMINILNGDVNYGAQSELATLLEGVADDC